MAAAAAGWPEESIVTTTLVAASPGMLRDAAELVFGQPPGAP